MARPTLAQQLAAAVAAGDMDKIKELSDKMNAAKPVKAKKPVKKAVPKPKVVKSTTEAEAEGEAEDIPVMVISETHFLARDPDFHEKREDGGTVSKKVPFRKLKNPKNTFSDDDLECAGDIEIDKMIHKYSNRPRNVTREEVKKVKVKCTRCLEFKVVWPGEVQHDQWICDSCILSNKRGGRAR